MPEQNKPLGPASQTAGGQGAASQTAGTSSQAVERLPKATYTPSGAGKTISTDNDSILKATHNMGALAALYEVVAILRAEANRSRKHDVIYHVNNMVSAIEQLARKYVPDLPPPPRTEPSAGARPRTAND